MFALKKYAATVFLFISALSIHLYSLDPERVERGYSKYVFPFISFLQRTVFGWLPFSIGDVLYTLLIAFLIYRLARYFRNRGRRAFPWKRSMIMGVNSLLILYILFNIAWGLNYNRPGVLLKLHIRDTAYTKDDLIRLNEVLVHRVNESKLQWIADGGKYPGKRKLFKMVEEAYTKAGGKYAFLKYKPASLKPSVWSIAGNYLGFTGYYNPFTGEAQVNTTTPDFLHPFTACHEVAHQIGFAKEMEANFVGALAAIHSTEPLMRYSVYLDLFFYANRNLYSSDSSLAGQFRRSLVKPVKEDIEEWRRFRLKHRSFMEPVFRWAYGIFLERNQQPQGIMAYDEVTSFIIAYYKREGLLPP